jgi:signal transduction histidine kinase
MRPDLPKGALEVRRAAEAFNFMQQRLRQLVVERGRALAAVSHDLRTPLTRMRLRAELVDDPVLQGKLNADIDAMQGMVNSVLAYLRGLEDSEAAQPIDMEALLSSLVEDEQAMGRSGAPGRTAARHSQGSAIRGQALGAAPRGV